MMWMEHDERRQPERIFLRIARVRDELGDATTTDYTRSQRPRASASRAHRKNSEPTRMVAPPSMIMPRYEPPSALSIAPATGPPQSALSNRAYNCQPPSCARIVRTEETHGKEMML